MEGCEGIEDKKGSGLVFFFGKAEKVEKAGTGWNSIFQNDRAHQSC